MVKDSTSIFIWKKFGNTETQAPIRLHSGYFWVPPRIHEKSTVPNSNYCLAKTLHYIDAGNRQFMGAL